MTTTTHQQALIAAIVDHPDDDTPRLVLADLLDEIGGESNHDRAEFIRIQCRLHGTEPVDSALEADRDREDELLRTHATRW